MQPMNQNGPFGVSRRSLLKGALGAAAIASVPALAACSSSSGGGASAGSNGMSFMYWGSSYEDQIVRDMLKAFTAKSGVQMTPMFTTGTEDQFNTKLNTLVAANNPPDISYLHAYTAYDFGEKGHLLNVADYFDKYPQLTERLPGTYYFWDEGKCLGNQTSATANLMYYKKSAFDKAGLAYPPAQADQAWDWDTFIQRADALTFDSNGKHPSEQGFNRDDVAQFGVSNFFTQWYPFVVANGGDITDPTGTEYWLDHPEAVEALQHLQDLIHVHRVAPTPKQQGASGTDTSTDLRSGRVAMVFDGTWAMLNLNQEKIDYGIGVHPKHVKSITVQLAGCTGVFGKTPDHDKAMEFYMFHNDPKNLPELYTSGLWLPLELSWYKDEKSIAFWVDNAGHPKEFKTAVIDVVLNHSVVTYEQRLKNIVNIREVLTPAIDQIQGGASDAKTVVANLKGTLTPLLQGKYPNPFLK